MNIICFHNPHEENGFLSNLYLSDFTLDGINYNSLEQYLMYQKAIYFNDYKISKKILNESNMKIIKELGRQVSNYNDTNWNVVRQIIIYKGLLAKFSQNADLANKLKSTGSLILAECAVKDTIWGIGISIKDENRFNQSLWKGQNLIGYTLMQVRNDI